MRGRVMQKRGKEGRRRVYDGSRGWRDRGGWGGIRKREISELGGGGGARGRVY